MLSAVLLRRPGGAVVFHAPRFGVTAEGRGMLRRQPRRAIALVRCERDLQHAIDLAQEAVSLALLAELAACDALEIETSGAYREAVGACFSPCRAGTLVPEPAVRSGARQDTPG